MSARKPRIAPRVAPCAGGCGGRVTATSRSGLCRACWGRMRLEAMRADPVIAAKIEAARRDPEIAARRAEAGARTRRARGPLAALDAEGRRDYSRLRRYGVSRDEALRALGAAP